MSNHIRKAVKIAALAGTSSLAVLLGNPASAQTICVNSPLGLLNCSPAGPDASVALPGLTQPVTVTLPDQFETTSPISAVSTQPITIVTQGVTTVTTTAQPALNLATDADIVAQVTGLNTTGNNAPGALLRTLDDVILIVDDSVTTVGNMSDGINITAGTINVTVDEVTTAGVDSDGVELVALSGPASLDADVIETLGDGSTDAIIRAAGDINVNVGVLRTEGDQALGLDLRGDAQACAVLGAGSCDIDAIVGNITTDGFGSIGALVVAAGDTDLDIDVLQTGGDQAAGLDLSADPVACLAVGVGGCDTAFTVDNLTTNGARSPGAIVRAVGDIDGRVGVLTTNGEDAIGLDLASDPDACVILGAGGCGTSFSVGRLTTTGDGAIGALVRAAGPTTANVTLLRTLGDEATGLDIAADPEACVLLGIGQCNTLINADQITTAGDLAAGVLVNAPAQIAANLGLVSTDGNNAPAISLITDPAVCLLIGAGACGVTLGSGGNGGTPGTPGNPGTPPTDTPGTPGGTNVDTDGNNSPGVVVVTPGPVDIDLGNVDTDGANSPGVDVNGGEGPIEVTFDTVDTDGVNSPGVDVIGTGPIAVIGGTVDTSGGNSPGVIVVGDNDPVRVDVGTVVTRGPNSDGVNVTTGTGNQTIIAGPITVVGLGSDGIDATANGCATVDVTARGPILATQGIGIDASSACAVRVTTLPGANVFGSATGINVVSGTGTPGGAVITIGAGVSSSNGPALNADGGPATVVIQSTGSLTGRFDLTNSNDTLTNNGTIVTQANSNFGAGTDSLVNTGTIRATLVPVTFAGLENTTNSGLIEMRDGATNDQLTLTGNYTGTGAARVGVDVAAGSGLSDRLVITGAATGTTTILADGLNGGFVNNAVVVDAGAGSTAGAFVFAPTSSGLVDYSLAFDPAGNNFGIFGTPNTSAVGLSLLAEGAREVFYRGNEAVAAHLGSGSVDVQPFSRALWFQGFGMVQDRERTLNATPFGQARSYNLDTRQDWFGGQVGLDLFGGAGSVFGITGGYIGSNLKFDAAPLRVEYEAANVGAYGRFGFGGLRISGLVKYEKYWVDVANRSIGLVGEADGDGWGGFIEAAFRLGAGTGFFVEPVASIEYANLNLDNFSALQTSFGFDEDEGLRGKAGVKVGTMVGQGPSTILAYGKVQAIHEFNGEDRLTLTNSGLPLTFDTGATDTYGRATIGVDITMTSGVRGFIEASADFEGGVEGGGARAGLSIPF